MSLKKWMAAAVLLTVATPSTAFDTRNEVASTMFYISIPLGADSRAHRDWSAGLLLQGKRDYPAMNLDSRMLSFLPTGDVDPKWIVAGLVAVGAAAAIGGGGSGTKSELQQQQTQQATTPPPSGGGGGGCSKPVADPCAK